ncbi:MAG: transposase [Patescibacteria group bacterium]
MEATRIDLTLDELRKIGDRLYQNTLDPGDYLVLRGILLERIEKEEKKIERAINRLRNLESQNSTEQEITSDQSRSSSESVPPPSAGPADISSQQGQDNPAPKPDPKPKGHGRNGASAYINAQHFFHKLVAGIIGSLCTCGAGRMRRYREKIIVRIVGQPLFRAEVHHFEQAICRICERIVTAEAPAHIQDGIGSSYIQYAPSACAMLIVMHYFGALPFKRIELLQGGWGVPFPDANQWPVVNISDDHLSPAHKALELYAMREATNFGIDDTGSMVISVMRGIKTQLEELKRLGKSTEDVRTGINATAVFLETPKGIVILYYTGLHHAGEILDQLMKYRESKGRPLLVKVTDAASKNFDHGQRDLLIEAVCNAHCFLKFQAIKGAHPAQYAIAGEVYKKVFDNDDIAKKVGMTPEQRMEYHKTHSKPLMEKLKTMCANLVANRLVEPNSKLWEPVNFVINQWPRLTKFYEFPNVPLHTNLVEQALIMHTRYLGSSFNYQTDTGSEVGDHHMSLIATAKANGREPVGYLEYCLKNRDDLRKNPEKYLPWNCPEKFTFNSQHKPPEPINQPP